MPGKRKRSREKTRNLFIRCIQKSLSRPEQLTVSQWAEKYRKLDESSALPGAWHNSVTPYLVGIMDCFNDPYVHYINFVKSAQVGGTEAMINALGWIITQSPSPVLIVYPTDDLAKDISNDRLKPAFMNVPEISGQFLKTKSNEMNLKFRSMIIYLRSGNVPSKLSSKSIKYLFFDEIDKMACASKHEASPYNLAAERTRTFKHSRKIYTCSTPTHRDNYIWKFHERADEQRYYFAPCPHCGEYITLEWKQVKFDENSNAELTNAQRAASAMYYCQECGAAIEDKDKPAMLQKGEWRDVKNTCRGRPQRVSFHLNALYSFFVSWSDAALEYLESRGDPETYQNFINSWLGEPWEDTKLKTTSDLVMARMAPEGRGIVPEWAQLLTAGADVQRNSVYFDIVAWGENLTSQSIMHAQLMSLSDLPAFMYSEYCKPNGEKFTVQLCLVDSGDQTDIVYEFCFMNAGMFPCKGVSHRDNYYKISKVDKPGGSCSGQTLVLVDGGKYKDLIAARLHYGNGIGSCMVHADCDIEYANQLASEHKIAEGRGARRKLVWRPKTSHADNHYLDCRVYASAAADLCGVRALVPIEQTARVSEPPKKHQEYSDDEDDWLAGY